MDFSAFDERGRAEAGAWVNLKDPRTKEIILGRDEDGKPNGKDPRALVRGTMARRSQKLLGKLDAEIKKQIGNGQEAMLEAVHENMIKKATALLMDLEHVNIGGKPVSPEQPEAFFDLSFPEFGMIDDENGAKKQGMLNEPFAFQIITASADYDNYLGNE